MPKTRSNTKFVSTGDDVTSNVDCLTNRFEKEMDKFRAELNTVRRSDAFAETEDVATLEDLHKRFEEFQATMETEVKALRERVASLSKSVSDMARTADANLQHSYRNKLLIYGIPEGDNENAESLVETILTHVNDKLKIRNIGLKEHDISDCHRHGKRRSDKPRAVVIDFVRVRQRNLFYGHKSVFKGTRVVVAEYLTKTRFAIFNEARKRFNRDCWTINGRVFANIDGRKRSINDLSDLN